MSSNTLERKIITSFNKVTKSLIRDLKDKKEDIKAILKTNYAAFDKTSDVYIKYFCKNINHEVLVNLMSDTEYDIFEADSVQDFNILNGLSIRKLLEVVVSETDKNTLLYYFQILTIFSNLYNSLQLEKETEDKNENENENEDKNENENSNKLVSVNVLLNKTLHLISTLNEQDKDFKIDEFLDDIFDDQLKQFRNKGAI